MTDRIHFEASSTWEDCATFVGDDDGIIVSVAEEKAVDSYNATFTCSLTMTLEQTIQLRDWLLKLYPVTGERTTPSQGS